MLRHRLLRLRTTQHRLHTRGKLHAWAQPWTRGTPRLPSPAKVFTARYPGRATDGSLRPSRRSHSEVSRLSTTRPAKQRLSRFAQRRRSGLSSRFIFGYMLWGISTTEQRASSKGISCISVDLLGNESLDLLRDSTYDDLLRLAFLGVIRYAHASPLAEVLSLEASSRRPERRSHPGTP